MEKKKALLYKCKKCGFKARGVVGIVLCYDVGSVELKKDEVLGFDQESTLMPKINLCTKCWYDWQIANLGELEIIDEDNDGRADSET